MAFHVGGEQYGVVRNDSWRELSKFSSVFSVDEQQRCVKLTDQLQSPHERTEKVNKVLIELRENQVFHSLKGWRNEVRKYKVDVCVYFMHVCVSPLIEGLI
jgi:hypothetical protein